MSSSRSGRQARSPGSDHSPEATGTDALLRPSTPLALPRGYLEYYGIQRAVGDPGQGQPSDQGLVAEALAEVPRTGGAHLDPAIQSKVEVSTGADLGQ